MSAIPQLVSAQWKTAGIMLCLTSGVRSFVGMIMDDPPSFTSFRKETVGTLSNYVDDHNDDFKKNDRFNDQNNSSARASRFLVHFFDVHCTTTT